MSEVRWYSISRLTSYARCSEAYRLEKVEKVPRTPAAWIASGTAFHEAVDQWEKSGRAADIRLAFEVSYWEEIGRLKEQEPDLTKWLRPPNWKPETDINKRYEAGCLQVQVYRDTALSEPWKPAELPDGSPASEVDFAVMLTSEIGLRGQVDLIMEWPDGSRRIRDSKTGAKLPGRLQLGTYRFAMAEALGWKIDYGDYYLAKKGVVDGPHDLRRYSWNVLRQYFEALDQGIRNGVYIPNEGDGCAPCSVRDFCREKGSRPVPLSDPKITLEEAQA